jgi:hypothetical protein
LCCMPCPSHPPWLDHSNYTWRSVQVMNIHRFIIRLFNEAASTAELPSIEWWLWMTC